MEAEALPDAFDVYFYCSTIFSGQSAQIRKLPKVNQLLTQNQKSIAQLTTEFTIPAIASVAAQLLKDKIFESQHLAYQQSSESEAEAAETAGPNDNNKEGEGKSNDESQDTAPKNDKGDVKRESTDKAQDELEGCEGGDLSAADRIFRQHFIPELRLIYLPFRTQHILLTTLQRVLERCCFDFGHHWVPDLMKSKGWLEVESIELTQWTQRFPKLKEQLSAATMKQPKSRTVAETLSAVGAIRHAAVHRVRTSAEEILDMLSAAETFTDMLCDMSRGMEVRRIKTELKRRIREIDGNQTLMRRQLMERLENIARSRADLDKLEKGHIEQFRATDERLRTEAGAEIEAYLDNHEKRSPLNESEKGEFSDERESVNALNAESEDGVILSSFNAGLQ